MDGLQSVVERKREEMIPLFFLCPQTSGSTSQNDGAEQSCDGDRIHSGRSGSPDFEKLQV